MFDRGRLSLTRFSLGNSGATLSISGTFTEELKQVTGVAIPVETTGFFNDVVRGSSRGTITVKSAFSSFGEMLTDCRMNADILLTFSLDEAMQTAVTGSQDSKIIVLWAEDMTAGATGSKNIPIENNCAGEIAAAINGVKDIRASSLTSAVLTALLDARTQTVEQTRIEITIPPNGELRIDSENYRVLLNGENVLYAQSGDWLTISRDLHYLDIESATGGSLTGAIIYIERYL